MELQASSALIFLPFVAVLCAIAVWTDLTRMKIPNRITDLLLLGFIPLGLWAFPWGSFLWQMVHPAVMLLLGLGLHSLRAMGAGDIKFLIAASPYVMLGDIGLMMMILAASLLLGAALHRLSRATIGPRIAPGWQSWKAGKRYPMGLSLGPALVFYLALAAF